MKQKLKNWLLVTLFFLLVVPAAVTKAQFGGVVFDTNAYIQRILIRQSELTEKAAEKAQEAAEKTFEEIFANAAAVSFKNSVDFFLQRIAQDTANWIGSGGKGKQPLFYTEGWGPYLQDVGEQAAAIAVLDFAEGVGLGDLCVSPSVAINIALPQLNAPTIRGPRCSLEDIGQAWDVTDPAFLENFTLSFSPNQNDLGISVNFLTNIAVLQDVAEEEAKNERLSGALKDVTTTVSRVIKTPKTLVEQTAETLSPGAVNSTVYQFTGRPIADAVDVFSKTLFSQLFKRLQSGIFSLADLGGSDRGRNSLNTLFSRFSAISDRSAADIFTPNIRQVGIYDMISQFTQCPTDIASAGVFNCVMDGGFAQAVRTSDEAGFITVRKAVDQGLLHGEWAFGYVDPQSGIEPSYLNGYSYSNMKKLRRARVIPVGWELAAIKARQLGEFVTLQNVLDGFNAPVCGSNQVSGTGGCSPFANLVDPDWVLKYPLQQCVAEVPGEVLIPNSADRQDVCVDLQDCVQVGDNGNCLAWGYCTNEQRVWAFPGQSCPDYYATCDNFVDTSGETGSHLWNGNTLTYEGCTAENAGCTWYSVAKNAIGEWIESDRVYLNGFSQDCSDSAAGCREYIRMGNGTNLILNSSFEDNSGNDYGTPGGDVAADNNIPDGWHNIQVAVQVMEEDLDEGLEPQEGDRFVRIRANSGGICSPGLRISYREGMFEPGQSYVLSGYIRTEENETLDAQVIFENIPFAIENVTDDWKPFVYQFEMPAILDNAEYELTLGTNDGSCNNLNAGIDIYYDAIQLEKGTDVSGYSEYGDINRIHLANAPACTFEDVGCQTYTPLNPLTGSTVTGIATGADLCPSECSGYQTYQQVGTDLEADTFVNFISSTANSCTAQEVGCTEYTNLDEVALGGEGLEYYTQIRHCEKPQPQCATYFTWEGSDISGFQLNNYSLLAENSDATGAPQTTDGHTDCDLTDPNCREFIDADGNRHRRLETQTITCSQACVPLRAPEGFVDQAQCESRLGEWEATTGRCIYQAIPSQSQQCSAQANGCREYIGNTGHNIFVSFEEDFEDGSIFGWSGEVAPSTESTNVGGQSMRLDGDTDQINEETSLTLDDGELLAGRTYVLEFQGKANVSDIMTVSAWLGDAKTSQASLGSVTSNTDNWNLYTLGPVRMPFDLSDEPELIFSVQGAGNRGSDMQFFFDNIIIRQIRDSQYLIKDSWETPLTCDTNPPLAGGVAGRSMIGCQEYIVTDAVGQTQNIFLKSFSRLCSEDAVGCEALIDTQNSTDPYRVIYNEGDESEIIVPADEVVYRVNSPEYTCREDQKGCMELGLPQFNQEAELTGFESVYKINNPDRYDEILCTGEGLFCRTYRKDDGSIVHAKDPLQQQCEYRLVPNSFPQRFAWFKLGDDEENPSDCVDAKINSFVQQCNESAISCTQYFEPITSESFYYNKNSLQGAEGECNGIMDWKQGCVLFNDTSDRSLTFKSGNDLDYVGPVDGCQTNDIGCNANTLLKVQLDRQCSQWLAPISSSRIWDPSIGDYRDTTYGLGKCIEPDPQNPNACRKWDNEFEKVQLSEEFYIDRDTSWAGEDYSGYSIPNQYPVETLRQFNISLDEDGVPSNYRLGHLEGPFGTGCTVNAECEGVVPFGTPVCRHELQPDSGLFDGECYAQLGLGTGKTRAVEASCRAFPEVDSPFDSSVGIYDPENPFKLLETKPLYQNANIGLEDEDVMCNYQKVTYAGSGVSDENEPTGTVYYGINSDPFPEYIERDVFLGWDGYCLETDPSRFVNGTDYQNACLTWYPVDLIQGAHDVSNSNIESEYIVGDDAQFYCAQAEFGEYLLDKIGCGGCDSAYYDSQARGSGHECSHPDVQGDPVGQAITGEDYASEQRVRQVASVALTVFGLGVYNQIPAFDILEFVNLDVEGFVLDQLPVEDLLSDLGLDSLLGDFNSIVEDLGLDAITNEIFGSNQYPEYFCNARYGEGWYPMTHPKFDANNPHHALICTAVARVQSPAGRNRVWTTRVRDREYITEELKFTYEQQNRIFGSARPGITQLEELDEPLIVKAVAEFAKDCSQCEIPEGLSVGICQDQDSPYSGLKCTNVKDAGSPYSVNSLYPQFVNNTNIAVRPGNADPDQANQPYQRFESVRDGFDRLSQLFAKSYGVWFWQVGFQNVCVGSCVGGVRSGEFCNSDSACGDPDIATDNIDYTCEAPQGNNGFCDGGPNHSLSCTSNADCAASNPRFAAHECVLAPVPTDPNVQINDPYICASGPEKGLGCNPDHDAIGEENLPEGTQYQGCNPLLADGVCQTQTNICVGTNDQGEAVWSHNSGESCASDTQCNAEAVCLVDRCSSSFGDTGACTPDVQAGTACGSVSNTNQYVQIPGLGWDIVQDDPTEIELPIVRPVIPDSNSANGFNEAFLAPGVNGFTINGLTSGPVPSAEGARDGSAPITISFYAYNDNGEQLPLRLLMVDWGDGSDPAALQGSFKNHRHQCRRFCSNDSGIACNSDSDCIIGDGNEDASCEPINFGDSFDGCTEDTENGDGFFSFNHTYTCNNTDGSNCIYNPTVIVRDNWGAFTRVSYNTVENPDNYIIVQPPDDIAFQQELLSIEAACALGGATIKQFGNACQDLCAPLLDPSSVQCSPEFTFGCNCGIDQCWDGTECVDNP